jgi:hypothetical protein
VEEGILLPEFDRPAPEKKEGGEHDNKILNMSYMHGNRALTLKKPTSMVAVGSGNVKRKYQ